MSREITHHRSVFNDFHSNIFVLAGQANIGGAPTNYDILVRNDLNKSGTYLQYVKFQDKCVETVEDINGVTNEILLAMVQDRLEGFQAGSFACAENFDALHHVKQALHALKKRTEHRIQKDNTGYVTGSIIMPAESEQRVHKTETNLVIGKTLISMEDLKTWSAWYLVEHSVKTLIKDTRLTEEELNIIRSCATTPAGKNGLAEFEQVYARMA